MMQSDFACDYCTRKDNCEKTSYDYGFCRYFVGIEVEPVRHGYWKESKAVPPLRFCNICGQEEDDYRIAKYCKGCGARMDGDE